MQQNYKNGFKTYFPKQDFGMKSALSCLKNALLFFLFLFSVPSTAQNAQTLFFVTEGTQIVGIDNIRIEPLDTTLDPIDQISVFIKNETLLFGQDKLVHAVLVFEHLKNPSSDHAQQLKKVAQQTTVASTTISVLRLENNSASTFFINENFLSYLTRSKSEYDKKLKTFVTLLKDKLVFTTKKSFQNDPLSTANFHIEYHSLFFSRPPPLHCA